MTCLVCDTPTKNNRKTCSSECLTQHKSNRAAKQWKNSETREKMSQGIKESWADEAVREKKMALYRGERGEEWKKKIKESITPEVIERRSKSIAKALRGNYHGLPAKGWTTDKNGYVVLTQERGHPLVRTGNNLYLHRKVLYEKIGPGPHKCHWCSEELEWGGWEGIQGDHLDGDILNNNPDNIVPSCGLCNRTGARLKGES